VPLPAAGRGTALLAEYPAACDALAELLGCEEGWAPVGAGAPGLALAGRYTDTAEALAALLAG